MYKGPNDISGICTMHRQQNAKIREKSNKKESKQLSGTVKYKYQELILFTETTFLRKKCDTACVKRLIP